MIAISRMAFTSSQCTAITATENHRNTKINKATEKHFILDKIRTNHQINTCCCEEDLLNTELSPQSL